MTEENSVVSSTVETVATTVDPAQQAVSTETQAVEALPSLEMDFSSFPVAPEPTPQPNIDQSYAEVIKSVVAEAMAKSMPQPKVEEDPTADDFVSKRDLDRVRQEAEQSAFEKIRIMQENERIIQTAVIQSAAVEKSYTENVIKTLESNGIMISQDPVLQDAFALSLEYMKLNEAQKLGKPNGAQIFSDVEMANIVKKHWEVFSNRIGARRSGNNPSTASRSAALNNINGQQDQSKPDVDPYQSFMEKKQAGKDTLQDALSLLLKKK
jgi:hypothetical protein